MPYSHRITQQQADDLEAGRQVLLTPPQWEHVQRYARPGYEFDVLRTASGHLSVTISGTPGAGTPTVRQATGEDHLAALDRALASQQALVIREQGKLAEMQALRAQVAAQMAAHAAQKELKE